MMWAEFLCRRCEGTGTCDKQEKNGDMTAVPCDDCDGYGKYKVLADWICRECQEYGTTSQPDTCPNCGEKTVEEVDESTTYRGDLCDC